MSAALYYWRLARRLLSRAMMWVANWLLDLAERVAPEDTRAKL